MSGAGDPMVIYDMGVAMRQALQGRRGERRIADWLGFHDCAELIRAVRANWSGKIA
jgi:hypothetical protein